MTKPRKSKNRGTRNVRSKLDEDKVLAIYQDTETSQSRLSEKYGVSQSSISHIKTGKTWYWLTQKAAA